ncbi:MAG TPA: DMT family transporter, partial [Herpetosiphonaceae bacterium]
MTTIESAPGREAAGSGGLLLGFCGVLGFSLTLPATRIAVATLHPAVVGLGRALVAACFAGLCLVLTKQRRPTLAECRGLLLVALGVILAFPLLSAWALRQVPASHGAVMTGLLPLATAVAATLRVGERPSPRFWATSVAGSLLVLAFALYEGAGRLSWADGALLLAVA